MTLSPRLTNLALKLGRVAAAEGQGLDTGELTRVIEAGFQEVAEGVEPSTQPAEEPDTSPAEQLEVEAEDEQASVEEF